MNIACLIPTIYRPKGLRRVLSSLRETAPSVTAIVAGEKDDVEARAICAEFGATFTACQEECMGPGYAYNQALAAAPGFDAYMLASDDCEFTPGWLEEVLRVLYQELDGSGLVGINDTRKYSANILAGRHQPTHYLMTRDFMVDHNGGLAAYPYPVDWTDIETNVRARRADKWAYAERAIVRHIWVGEHAPDEAFRRNQGRRKEAKALYFERQAAGFPDDLEAILQ